MVKLGNLLIAGIITGSIYAVFSVCVAVWFRVSNILNLAVGDFAMLGAMIVYGLTNNGLTSAEAIPLAIIGAGVLAYLYDRVVLHLAQDGKVRHEGIVVTFFFTFALSFFIEGVAEIIFGTNVHAAPQLWPGNSLTLGGLNFERAGILVVACAVLSGLIFVLFMRFTLTGKALAASGENYLGARIVGISTQQYRRNVFVATAVLAAILGILESPITGFVYSSGSAISLTGFIAAAYAGFQRPGRAVLAGVGIGVVEALLSGYVSSDYGEALLYLLVAVGVLSRPRQLGLVIEVA